MIKTVFYQMEQRDWIWLFVTAAIVSFFGVFGASYVFGQGAALFPIWLAIILIVIGTVVVAGVMFLLDVAFAKFDKESGTKSQREFERLLPRWNWKSIAIFTLIMMACWLPWYIANFPGGAYWDTYFQIYQVYPENHPIAIIPWSDVYQDTLTDAYLVDHHPVFVTAIYGLFGWLSDQLTGTWMMGVAIFTGLSGIAHCIAFTTSVAYLRRIGCSPALCFAAFLFFALMPFVPTWAMCMVKDSFFGLFYIPYFMMLAETVRTRGAFLKKRSHFIWMIVLAIVLCITKKQGIFVIVATAIVGWFAFWWRGRRAAAKAKAAKATAKAAKAEAAESAEAEAVDAATQLEATEAVDSEDAERASNAKTARHNFIWQAAASIVTIAILFPLVLFPLANIAPGGKQEILGPLFQQTARYVIDHGDEVTDEQREAISAVIDWDHLTEGYSYNFQDTVKYYYNLNSTDEDLMRYLGVYFEQGARHPDTYFAAFMSLAGYYVAPTAPINIRMTTVDTLMGPSEDNQRHMLWNPEELSGMRNGLNDLYSAVSSWPVINLPLLIVTYALWLPALLIYVGQRRRMGGVRTAKRNGANDDALSESNKSVRSVQRKLSGDALDGYAWMLLIVPQLVLLAFCMISPTYDGRYVIPIFDIAPLMYCMFCVLLKQRDHTLSDECEKEAASKAIGMRSARKRK